MNVGRERELAELSELLERSALVGLVNATVERTLIAARRARTASLLAELLERIPNRLQERMRLIGIVLLTFAAVAATLALLVPERSAPLLPWLVPSLAGIVGLVLRVTAPRCVRRSAESFGHG